MKTVLVLVALFALPSLAQAQTATPTNHLGWTQVGQTAAYAQSATYNTYVDGAATPSPLANVTCIAAGNDATCTGDFPPLVPGGHSLTLTQMISGVEAPKSTALSFTFVVVVTPTGLMVK